MSVLETRQNGGTHYKGMGIQPIEIAHRNRYDPCTFSALKYLSRHRSKAGALDLTKAVDFIDFRIELLNSTDEILAAQVIPMSEYLKRNAITDPREKEALTLLHYWAIGKLRDPEEAVKHMKGLINDLRVDLYGKE